LPGLDPVIHRDNPGSLDGCAGLAGGATPLPSGTSRSGRNFTLYPRIVLFSTGECAVIPMDLRLTDDRLADDESSGRLAIFWTYALGIAAGALMAVII
jgi:hypothetical protein